MSNFKAFSITVHFTVEGWVAHSLEPAEWVGQPAPSLSAALRDVGIQLSRKAFQRGNL